MLGQLIMQNTSSIKQSIKAMLVAEIKYTRTRAKTKKLFTIKSRSPEYLRVGRDQHEHVMHNLRLLLEF